MTKAEQLAELRRLQQQGMPEAAQAFSEWAHEVRPAILGDGERQRWDFLAAKYKSSDPATAEARSTRLEMEQLVGLEVGDLEDYAKHPGKEPMPFDKRLYLILIIITAFFRFYRPAAPTHPSPDTMATPSPVPKMGDETNVTKSPAPAAISATPKPQW
jgi:hypothetical protein